MVVTWWMLAYLCSAFYQSLFFTDPISPARAKHRSGVSPCVHASNLLHHWAVYRQVC